MSQIDIGIPFSYLPQAQLGSYIDMTLHSMVDQLNGQPQIYAANTTGIQPETNAGDIIIGQNGNGNLTLAQNNGNGVSQLSQDTIQQAYQFQAPTSGSGDPTTTQFPTNGAWGIYTDTSSGNTYMATNTNGTIVKSQLT